jgi:hypothetical protein
MRKSRAIDHNLHFPDNSVPFDPKRLADWLNLNHATDAGQRVIRLMTKIMDVMAVRLEKDFKKLSAQLIRINRKLARYVASPAFTFPHNQSLPLNSTWAPKASHNSGVEYSEFRYVLVVMKLARDEKLDRIRACKLDQRWFYAKLRHQVFCSEKCQQKAFRQSPDFKKYHAARMKSWRRQQQEGFEL